MERLVNHLSYCLYTTRAKIAPKNLYEKHIRMNLFNTPKIVTKTLSEDKSKSLSASRRGRHWDGCSTQAPILSCKYEECPYLSHRFVKINTMIAKNKLEKIKT